MKLYHQSPDATLYQGEARVTMPTLPGDTFDSVITDPPYELGFMGAGWDKTGVAFDPATWAAVLTCLRPGGYLLAMGGTRTYHRLTCAVEEAGFEIRDCLMWLYGTGFPKGKACLKPAWEPILLARKPGRKVTPLGIDGCRIPATDSQLAEKYRSVRNAPPRQNAIYGQDNRPRSEQPTEPHPGGRYPANVVHDGSDEVMEAFAAFGESKSSGGVKGGHLGGNGKYGAFKDKVRANAGGLGDSGTAARFFYCAKASKRERGDGNTHPTVKPLALMRWMVRLITPPAGITLDPFAGSATTMLAARLEGRRSVGIEEDAGHCEIAAKRLANPTPDDDLTQVA